MNNIIIEQSIENLKLSHDELVLAVNHLLNIIINWNIRLINATYLSSEEKSLVNKHYEIIKTELDSISSKLDLFKLNLESLTQKTVTNSNLDKLILEKKLLYSRLRICLSNFASLLTCLNWQSPSIKSSQNTRIGIEKFPIKTDWNDYKRDRSGDTFYCEEILEKNVLVSQNTNIKPVLNVFSSGMAAFTTLMYFLICEGIVKHKVIASTHNYIESRMILNEMFKNKLQIFDTNNADSIIEVILLAKPEVVFLEPLSNTNNLRLFDVVKIVNEISKVYKDTIYFIFDVTCIVGFENLFDDFKIPDNIKVILHGSILKSPQLGLERVNAGFIQTFGLGKESDKILDYRTLSGTNIQDFATNLLPFTNKKYLQKRMKIIESNAINLASFLYDLDKGHELFGEIVYPGLKSHKDYELSKKVGFAGTFFNIKFIEKFNKDKYFESLTQDVINIAKKNNCDIVHGASFGFNQLSIYYSVGWEDVNDHYLRLSLGTETEYEIEKIKKVFAEAFETFKTKYINY